jgi:hypothetical protein
MSMPNGDATHSSPPVHSEDDAHSWMAPMPLHEAAHAMVTPPMPKPLQHTSPFEQSCELAHDCLMPRMPVSKSVVASDGQELDPELEPELDPDPLDAPELEFNPPPSSAGLPLVDDPPHAAASAAAQLPMKRSLLIRMVWPSCLKNGPRRLSSGHPIPERGRVAIVGLGPLSR